MNEKKVRTPADYPQPIPVITGDCIGFLAADPYTIRTVILRTGHVTGEQHGESQGKILLPGGIYEIAKHNTPWDIGVIELKEETGFVLDKSRLIRFLLSYRTQVDQRAWCELRTTHCYNHVVAAPITQVSGPTDTEEVAKVLWTDVRTMTPEQSARGHFEYMQAWRAFLDHNGGKFDGSILKAPIELSDKHPAFVQGHPHWIE